MLQSGPLLKLRSGEKQSLFNLGLPKPAAQKGQSPRVLAIGRKRASHLIFKTQEDLMQATQALIVVEPKFAPVLNLLGLPSLRRIPNNLESLLLIVTEQFLSLKAAAAIWVRVKTRLGEISPQAIFEISQTEFVTLGLSRAKAKCFHACAKAKIDFENFATLRGDLLNIWGVGPWTIDIFMLTAWGEADAWPAGDVALKIAVQNLFGLATRPSSMEMESIAQSWRPARAAAARLLWAHYRHLKALPQAPSQN